MGLLADCKTSIGLYLERATFHRTKYRSLRPFCQVLIVISSTIYMGENISFLKNSSSARIAASRRIESFKVKQASPAFLSSGWRHARKQQMRKHTRNKGENSGTVPLLAAFLGTEKGQRCRYHDHVGQNRTDHEGD
jgi:hypothetical protein